MKKLPSQMVFLMEASLLVSQLNKRVEQNLSIHGISLTEFMVLHHLHESPNQMMSRIELASAVGLSASGVTRLLNPMEKLHLVQKEQNQRDARKSMVKLSDTGLVSYADARATYASVATSMFKPQTTKTMSELLNVLRAAA